MQSVDEKLNLEQSVYGLETHQDEPPMMDRGPGYSAPRHYFKKAESVPMVTEDDLEMKQSTGYKRHMARKSFNNYKSALVAQKNRNRRS